MALLGTDRRDPPEPPPGPLADVVADAVAPTAVGAHARPPSAPASPPAGPACCRCRRRRRWRRPSADDRPMLPPAAARRWRTIVAEWPVLEDEWLHVVERRGWRLPPDVLVGLLRRHRTDAARRARVRAHRRARRRLAGRAPAGAAARRAGAGRAAVDDRLPGLAVPPTLLPLLEAPARRRSSPPSLGGLATARSGSPTAPCSSTSSPASAPTGWARL